jgi:hypothetical protein
VSQDQGRSITRTFSTDAPLAPQPRGPAARPGLQPISMVGDAEDGPNLSPLVVFNDPEAPHPSCPRGWSLLSAGDDNPRVVEPLDCRGAGHLAGPRVAKAVAVRVLAERGVRVQRWHPDDRSVVGLPTYRAAGHSMVTSAVES